MRECCWLGRGEGGSLQNPLPTEDRESRCVILDSPSSNLAEKRRSSMIGKNSKGIALLAMVAVLLAGGGCGSGVGVG